LHEGAHSSICVVKPPCAIVTEQIVAEYEAKIAAVKARAAA